MGKKKSGRIGGIRLEVKSNADVKTPACSNNVNNAAQKPSGPAITKSMGSLEAVNIDIDVESPLEKLMAKASDEGSLKAFAQTWDKVMSDKMALRAANTNVSYDEFEKLISSKKLDSNLKKCTAFVRKMKQYTDSQKSSIETDLKTLNLTKYLSEITAAVTEARFKIGEILDVIMICSWIHQRYSDFAPMLLENYRKAFPTKKIDFTPAVLSKLSVDLRMIGDLVICGILPSQEGYSLLVSIIRNMIGMDKEGVQCLIPIISFCRGLGDDFLGVLPRTISTLCHQYAVNLIRSDVSSSSKKEQLRSNVKEYFLTTVGAMLKMHKEVQSSEMHNRRVLKTKGEISSDRKEAHLGIVSKFEKYHANVVKFADLVDEDLPGLPCLPADPDEEEERQMLLDESGEPITSVPGIVLFDDEETRSFYQDYKDLKVYLPPVAYRESVQQAAEQTQAIEAREKELANFEAEEEVAELIEEKSTEEETAQEVEGDLPPSMLNEKEEHEIDKHIKPTFQVFLNNLPNCVNRNMIDKAAVEFAENHNNKPNRKKLINTLFRVPRQRMDLIAFYSRLVAILSPVMPDIGLELCQLLKNDFRYLVRKKHQIFVETKVKITRFIGELVNFKIFPKSDALQCLKILLLDFVHHQVEMACVFVETCGRFLYRTPDSHRRMKIYLEEMIRKKAVKTLEPRYVSMIDHAFFFVCPPEGGTKTFKKRPLLNAYLRFLIFDCLSKETLHSTVEQLKTLDWEDQKVFQVGMYYLTRPWKVTYQQLPYYAKLLVGLKNYEPELVQNVIDALVEDIRRGIERFGVNFNHRRVSTIRFLSELYDFRILGSPTLMDILYMLITYGTTLDVTRPSPIDPPDNLFRIRLACYILRDSGECLSQGSTRKKLKYFLKYLQRYFWFKKDLPIWGKSRFPYGIQELWEDVMLLMFPKTKLAKSLEDAQKEVDKMEQGLKEKMGEEVKQIIESVNSRLEVIDENDEYEMSGHNGGLQNMAFSEVNSGQGDGHQLGKSWISDMSELGACGGYDPNQYMPSGNQNNYRHSIGSSVRNSGHNNQYLSDMPFNTDQPLDPYDDFERAAAAMRAAQQRVTPEDEEFMMMLDRMCAEPNHGGKHIKTDIPIPLHIRNSSHSTSKTSVLEGNAPGPTGDAATVPFVLITRKGNKQQFKTLDVPADSDFVQKIKSREEAERAEKESVKMRTLAISQLQEQEERDREHEAIKSVQKNTSAKAIRRENKILAERNRKKFEKWSFANSYWPGAKQ